MTTASIAIGTKVSILGSTVTGHLSRIEMKHGPREHMQELFRVDWVEVYEAMSRWGYVVPQTRLVSDWFTSEQIAPCS